MITFDTPYEGKIVKARYNSKIVLKLYDTTIESSKIKHIASKFIKTISIDPMSGFTQITASIPTKEIGLKVSKTADGYGLRLRFIKKVVKKEENKKQISKNPLSNLPTQKNSLDISISYYIVMGILLIGIVFMFYLKRKITKDPNELKQKGWMFGASKLPKKDKKITQNRIDEQETSNNATVTIRFQKNIDEKNNVVYLEFAQRGYLILFGENNEILLDKFIEDKPKTQNEFEEILEKRNIELDKYTSLEQKEDSQEKNEDILKVFSTKASKIPFDI
jgi:hypothetical protein